eukprot:4988311-Amphidinium_carterae.1
MTSPLPASRRHLSSASAFLHKQTAKDNTLRNVRCTCTQHAYTPREREILKRKRAWKRGMQHSLHDACQQVAMLDDLQKCAVQ